MKPASPKPAFLIVAQTASPRVSAVRPGPMSPANAFEGRGRGPGALRYRHMPLAPVPRDAAREAWAAAVARVFRSREVCAAEMAVTFQTACNWFDAFSTPTGDKVMQFSRDYPDAYAAMLARIGGDQVAA